MKGGKGLTDKGQREKRKGSGEFKDSNNRKFGEGRKRSRSDAKTTKTLTWL